MRIFIQRRLVSTAKRNFSLKILNNKGTIMYAKNNLKTFFSRITSFFEIKILNIQYIWHCESNIPFVRFRNGKFENLQQRTIKSFLMIFIIKIYHFSKHSRQFTWHFVMVCLFLYTVSEDQFFKLKHSFTRHKLLKIVWMGISRRQIMLL